jgi:hypothetical protein
MSDACAHALHRSRMPPAMWLPLIMIALCNFLILGCEDELIAFHGPTARPLQGFTDVHAGNPPQGYTDRIVETLGVSADTQISTFLS